MLAPQWTRADSNSRPQASGNRFIHARSWQDTQVYRPAGPPEVESHLNGLTHSSRFCPCDCASFDYSDSLPKRRPSGSRLQSSGSLRGEELYYVAVCTVMAFAGCHHPVRASIFVTAYVENLSGPKN